MNNRNEKIIQLLKRRQKGLTVFMDEVHKPHNLAAIVRTCDAVGIGEVHAVYPEGMLKACHGTAKGSNRWVETKVHNSLEEGIKFLKSQSLSNDLSSKIPSEIQVMAAHFSEKSIDYREVDYTKPSVILVGSEKYGVSQKAADIADHHILIPMLGMVQSLNVSVASAIILYEAQRQREIAGFYKEQQIDEQTFERFRFEWLHPQIKDFCLKHDIRYPKIDKNGDIRDQKWDEIRHSIVS